MGLFDINLFSVSPREKAEFMMKVDAVDLVGLRIHQELLGSKKNRERFPKFANVVFGPWYERFAKYKSNIRSQLDQVKNDDEWQGMLDTLDLYQKEVRIYDKRWNELKAGAPDKSGKAESVKKTKKDVKKKLEQAEKAIEKMPGGKAGAGAMLFGGLAALGALGLLLFTRKK